MDFTSLIPDPGSQLQSTALFYFTRLSNKSGKLGMRQPGNISGGRYALARQVEVHRN